MAVDRTPEPELTREQAAKILAKRAAIQDGYYHRGYAWALRMGADALLDAARLTARVAELEQENDKLKELLDDTPEHVIDVRADGWTLKHPIACRPHLFDCPFNEAASGLYGPPSPPGRYAVTLDDTGGLLIGEATPDGR